MIIIIIAAIVFCLPADAGFWLTGRADQKSLKIVRNALIGIACLCSIVWIVAWPTMTFVYAIGGGNPTLLQLAFASFIVTSPLFLGAIVTVVSLIGVNHAIGKHKGTDNQHGV